MTYHGIINIKKERGMTSHDVVGRVRRIFGMKRVGHTGTLDPMADGVLPVCLGQGTRIIEYLDADWKVYRAGMRLGQAFDTEDIWGQVVEEAPAEKVAAVTEDMVRDVLRGMTGRLLQVPPMYSAVRVNGKRLYEYARAGKTVERKARETWIDRIDIESSDLGPGSTNTVIFTVKCTRGTYVRTLCREAGERLGVPAAMSQLTRTASGIFTLEHAFTLDELAEMSEEERGRILMAPDRPLTHLGCMEIGSAEAAVFRNGIAFSEEAARTVRRPEFAEHDFVRPIPEGYRHAYLVYEVSEEGAGSVFLGIGALGEARMVKPVKVFAAAERI